jgi:hypothetical protein
LERRSDPAIVADLAQAQRDAEDKLLAGLTKTQRAQLLLILREQFSAEADTSCPTSAATTRS